LFVWPTVLGSHSYLPLRTNKHVLGTNISHLFPPGVERVSGREDRVDQIPQFPLLEDLAVHSATIYHLVPQEIGVVLVADLPKEILTDASPPLPQNSVLVNL
jgi:hypothetical protein